MSTNLTAVLQELLQNTANLKSTPATHDAGRHLRVIELQQP
jgi:hypothetical protein